MHVNDMQNAVTLPNLRKLIGKRPAKTMIRHRNEQYQNGQQQNTHHKNNIHISIRIRKASQAVSAVPICPQDHKKTDKLPAG